MSLDLLIDIQKEGPLTILAVQGELDGFHAPKLSQLFHQTIEDDSCKNIILDLDKTTFIDSVGIGTIAIAGKKLLALDSILTVVCSKHSIIKLIETSGITEALHNHLVLYTSIEEAKTSLPT